MSKKRHRLPLADFLTTIENLSHEGRGVSSLNGKKVFIANALPGETVWFRHTKSHYRYAEGITTKVVKAASNRIDARCQHFMECGGCSLQHLTSQDQMEFKQKILIELLTQQGVTAKKWLPPLQTQTWHYRNKARIGLRYFNKSGDFILGFRGKSSSAIINLNECPILDNRIESQLNLIRETLSSLSNKEEIPQIEVAGDENNVVMIIRHLTEFNEVDINKLNELAKKTRFTLYLQPNSADSIHPLNLIEKKVTHLSYKIGELNIEFKPYQFTQVNQSINVKMIEQAMTLLDLKNDDEVLDLFCGIGNFSLPIAKKVKTVVGIEGDESAVEQAKHNAKINQIDNAFFYTANLFESIDQLTWSKKSFNKVMLDPPRSGAKEIINQLIAKQKPQKIVYVSCNPASLARDAKMLLEQGYRLSMAGIMDMFPHTQHVETITLFTLKK